MATSYATADEFKESGLPPVALLGLDDATIDKCIERASGLVDSYIGQRFKLPLVSYGNDIKQCAIDLAAFYTMKHRGFQPGAADADTVRMAFEDALRWLKDVQAGRATPAFPATQDADGFDPNLSSDGDFAKQSPSGGIGLDTPDLDVLNAPPSSRGW